METVVINNDIIVVQQGFISYSQAIDNILYKLCKYYLYISTIR